MGIRKVLLGPPPNESKPECASGTAVSGRKARISWGITESDPEQIPENAIRSADGVRRWPHTSLGEQA